MARPMKPLVRGGGYYPSNRWTPLVYPGGYTTSNGGGQPEPETVLKTVTGSLIHITDALALPAEALSVNVEPIQAGSGDPSPDNVRPISGRTSATVTRTGKNLLNLDRTSGVPVPTDISNTTSPRVFDITKYYEGARADNYYYKNYVTATIESGTVTVTLISGNNNYGVGFPVGVIGGGTYTFSANFTNGRVAFGYYDSSWNYISSSNSFTSNATITVPSETAYMVIVLRCNEVGTTVTFTNLQLELGSTASAYEPYTANTYTIQLGDTVYGGMLDVKAGKMVVDRAMVINSSKATKYENANGWYWYSTADELGAQRIAGANAKLICNRLHPTSNVTATSLVGEMSWYANNIIRWKEYGELTQAEYRGYLAENPLQFCYELATPFEITLTPTQIDMLLGENNLWADAGDSTLTYYAEGEASTSEALGILLGGTYNNPGGADDVSDDEALGILLGGS